MLPRIGMKSQRGRCGDNFLYPDTEKQFKIQNLAIFNLFIKQSIIFQSYRTQEVTTLGKAVASYRVYLAQLNF